MYFLERATQHKNMTVWVTEAKFNTYAADPIASLMNDIGGDISHIQFGTLDVSLILDSEYAFA